MQIKMQLSNNGYTTYQSIWGTVQVSLIEKFRDFHGQKKKRKILIT